MTDHNNSGNDHKVGYRRPPKHTQFKKGQSGNPGGRPRKRGTVKIDVEALLQRPVTVVQDGKPCVLSPKEVSLRKMLKKAVEEQHLRSIIYLLELFEKHNIIELPTKHAGGVVRVPNTMPSRMADIMLQRFGVPPWSQAKLAKGRAAYLATRTDEEKLEDDLMEYEDL
jgi:hypothetical protein